MAEHTPGRLGYEPTGAGDYFEIAPLGSDGQLDWTAEVAATASGGEEAEANARRLVSLWNALDGVGTESLEWAADAEDAVGRLRRLACLVENAHDHAADRALAGGMDDA